jgi:ATP-dependent Lhr-like helicase
MHEELLSLFHPATARWFRDSFARPTPPQVKGWPEIAAGRNTLILAPTGSGKTLAAFLYAIDELITRREEAHSEVRGVHTLYLSPLKALANDIERNLDPPLRGIRSSAERLGVSLPEIRVGLRTGDTPPAARQRMVRNPPDLLVTTPESLHLLLTSAKAREILRTVRYVIVDEIHALCSDKRGTFLSLLLERLEELTSSSPIRIGLSATQRPLEEVARFLGGHEVDGTPRPVTIVDAGMRKNLDLAVITPVEDMKDLPRAEDLTVSIWPSIYERLLGLVEQHTSTLIFGNSRRVVERLAAEMNRLSGVPLVRAHHGSVSKEERHQIEEDLKAGRLPALVATASMELGIDVGAIDLVCQVEAPFSVATGLQRVGRAGHLVRATSVGRMIPKTRADLLVMAAVSRAMLRGEISAMHVPKNPLDVLAQQIVAMVAMDEWTVDRLYARIRRAAPYRDLPQETYLAVLELLAGRYRTPASPALRPRVSWERSTGRLHPLPGSRHAVLLNGGAIPDTGQYAMVLEDGKTRIGELDEEFVFERRLGETFILGTGCWRILEVTHDRVIVAPAENHEGMMPFWKGEGLGRDAEFGARFGGFLRECEGRLGSADLEAWLAAECALDPAAARNLAAYLTDQRERGGAVPNDRRILIDVFRNEAGDVRMSVLSPFGRAFHLALLLGIQRPLRDRGHGPPEAIFSGDGILFRPGTIPIESLIEAIRGLRADRIVSDLVGELESTPFFAMRFRRNAGRALLLPRARPGRRTPLWLQRLRAHDLLAVASEHAGFPIVTETYREIIEDELPLEAVQRFLRDVEQGSAEFVVRRDRSPSPFSGSLLLDFTGKYLYEDDTPIDRAGRRQGVREDVVRLLGERIRSESLFDPDAVRTMDERLQGIAPYHRARDGAELVELLRRIGDLTEDEALARCELTASSVLPELIEDRRLIRVSIAGSSLPERLVAADDVERYRRMNDADVREIVRRYVASRAVTDRAEVLARYPVAVDLVDELLRSEGWIEVERSDGTIGWSDPDVAAGIRRLTLAERRRRITAASTEAYSRYLLAHHHCGVPLAEDDIAEVMEQLAGCALPVSVWDDVLSIRICDYDRGMLDRLVRGGELAWYGRTSSGGQRHLAFAPHGCGLRVERCEDASIPGGLARLVVKYLDRHGASFLHQIAAGTDRPPSEVAAALRMLIWGGWVTNDSLDAAWGEGPRPDRRRAPRRGAAWGGGRWSIVEAGGPERSADHVRTLLNVLLHRYGILNREVLARDGFGLRWVDVYPVLTRREWAGEVERGLFVSGLSAPQFAPRVAVDRLGEPGGDTAPVLVNVFDPACIHGDLVPIDLPNGERYVVRHHPGNYLVVRDGRPLLAVESRGERLVPLAVMGHDERREALATLPRLVEGRSRPPSARVKTWDGRSVVDTAVAGELEKLGFAREDRSMILYREYAARRLP